MILDIKQILTGRDNRLVHNIFYIFLIIQLTKQICIIVDVKDICNSVLQIQSKILILIIHHYY